MQTIEPIQVRIIPADSGFVAFTYTGRLGEHNTLALGSESTEQDIKAWVATTLVLHTIHPALHAPDKVQRGLMTALDAYEHNAYKD